MEKTIVKTKEATNADQNQCRKLTNIHHEKKNSKGVIVLIKKKKKIT